MNELPLITTCPDVSGKRVLVRLDLNVPLFEGKIRDPFRIEKSLATVNYLRDAGARVVIMSHIGKGKPMDTLAPVADYLNTKFPTIFLSDLMGSDNVARTRQLQGGDVALLENLRHSEGEEANDPAFASYLATLGDIYVNDAFPVSHRAHASVVGVVPHLPHYAGLQMAEEVKRLAVAFTPERPFLFILGGAKISTKMPLLKKFIGIADNVFIGGAITNNVLKAKGYEIGTSVIDASELGGLDELIANERLVTPRDVVVKNASGKEARVVGEVHKDDMIVDVGSETIAGLSEIVSSAKLIVWNGPLGFYEEGFTGGTKMLLNLIANSSATSIIGGGDTVALIDELGMIDKFSFVSTGGGAMLDYLASETLPGIQALQK
jgi:phosphoglycerate kinase